MIATSFGMGFLPVCPGTWGALLSVVLFIPLYLFTSPSVTFWATLAATLFFLIAGTWASSVSEKYWGKDPVVACVDETVGQFISMLPISALCPWWEIILSLALFRFFDIFKPLGIRSLERLPKGYGMMADDVLSGVYAAVLILILNYFML
jgi:phosphatidylglycerophosphatase A